MRNFKLTNGLRGEFIRMIQAMDLTKPKRVDIADWRKKRSLSANGQQHVWYDQIAKHFGDRSAKDVKCQCKNDFGLPILHNSATYGEEIEYLTQKLGYYSQSYENKMKLISCLAVTSKLNTAESKEYMDQLVFYWNNEGVPIKYQEE